jgi:hypothetical protein
VKAAPFPRQCVSRFAVIGSVELWATRQRRPSAAANPESSPRPLRSPPESCNPRPGAVGARYRSGPTGRRRYVPPERWHRPSGGPLRTLSCATAARRRSVSNQRPRPSTLIRTPAVSSLSVNAVLVNCPPVGVEDLWPPVPQGVFKCVEAERGTRCPSHSTDAKPGRTGCTSPSPRPGRGTPGPSGCR